MALVKDNQIVLQNVRSIMHPYIQSLWKGYNSSNLLKGALVHIVWLNEINECALVKLRVPKQDMGIQETISMCIRLKTTYILCFSTNSRQESKEVMYTAMLRKMT